MKELNGIQATAQIVKKCPETAVLILSMHSDERYVARALAGGHTEYPVSHPAPEANNMAFRP